MIELEPNFKHCLNQNFDFSESLFEDAVNIYSSTDIETKNSP